MQMQSGCQSNDVKSNALATIARAENSDVTKSQREAIGMWGSRLSVRYRSKRTYANATLMGLKLSLNRIALRAFGHGMSERRACRLVKQPRGTQRYRPTQRDDEDALTRAIITLASQYGRFGYRRITVELRTAGWRSSHGTARDQNARSWPARDRDRWRCCRCLACCSGQKVVWILHFKTQIVYPASSFHVGRRQRNHSILAIRSSKRHSG
jgi:hypothetical protein